MQRAKNAEDIWIKKKYINEINRQVTFNSSHDLVKWDKPLTSLKQASQGVTVNLLSVDGPQPLHPSLVFAIKRRCLYHHYAFLIFRY